MVSISISVSALPPQRKKERETRDPEGETNGDDEERESSGFDSSPRRILLCMSVT